MAVVSLNYNNWIARYPEFAATVPQNLALLYFNEAGLYCDNTTSSPVQDDSVGGQRDQFLQMITAHIAALNAPNADGSPASPLVGRIASAGQGSVNVSTDNQYPPGSSQWFQQTKYGAAFWGASKRYRSFRYINRPRRQMDAYAPYVMSGSDPTNPVNPNNPNPLPTD